MHPIIPSFLLWLVSCFLISGCASSPSTDNPSKLTPARDPIALVDARAITIDAIAHAMSELAGREALIEYVLDRALAQRTRALGIEITPADVEHERALLGETMLMIDDQAASARVIDTLRRRRGLGPERYERLLRRNAMLRALVGAPDTPKPEALQVARDQAFGERYRVRLFVHDKAGPASALRQKILQAEAGAQQWLFADACYEQSTHPSADRGGLIVGISPSSTGYPQGVLDSIRGLSPGSCSSVISTEAGYALVYLESITPASTPSETQINELIERMKQDNQRLAMQRLAQELLGKHEVIVLDSSLNWSWANRP